MADRSSSWRAIQLHGGAPWGFRLSNTRNSKQPGLDIAKVRTRSKAYLAGLRDNDSIVYINDVPTHSMTIHQASSLIESLDDLSLTVISNSSRFRRDSETSEKYQAINEIEMNSRSAFNNNNNSNRFSSNDRQSSQQYLNTSDYSSSRHNNNRNYFSATESCGEETDTDSVFGFDTRSKQSYASITLRPPLKDVNYFSDTEARSALNSSNYRVKNQVPRQYAPPKYPSQSSSNQYQVARDNSSIPVYYQQHQSQQAEQPKNKGSFSLLGQQKSRQLLPTDNPYSPSTVEPQVFKVPNIYDKLNTQQPQQQRRPSYQPQSNYNSYLMSQIEQHQRQEQQPVPEVYRGDNLLRKKSAIEVEDDYRRYEAEMGAELVKPAHDSGHYADSYFYNTPLFNYPTIDDQKKLAKVIAATLEGSDPERSKYHKSKKRQQQQQKYNEEEENYYNSQMGNSALDSSYMITSPTVKSPGYNAYVHDQNIPEVIRKSIEQAEMHDPIRMVQAQEQFKQLHFAEHNTHTEMPPQAAMSLAAALHQAGGRGAELFQRRKAKAEKWVVDESNVKTPTAPATFFGQPVYNAPPSYVPPQSMSKLAPAAPVPVVRRESVTPIIPQRAADPDPHKFADFNVRPRGWGDDQGKSRIKPVNQSIREGIQEVHNRHNEPQRRISQQSMSQYDDYSNSLLASNQPNRLDTSQWQPRDQHQYDYNKNISITKDGISNLKQRFYNNVQETNQRSTYNPVISKVKLNRLNTNDFLTNINNSQHAPQQQQQQQSRNYNYNDEIAASDL